MFILCLLRKINLKHRFFWNFHIFTSSKFPEILYPAYSNKRRIWKHYFNNNEKLNKMNFFLMMIKEKFSYFNKIVKTSVTTWMFHNRSAIFFSLMLWSVYKMLLVVQLSEIVLILTSWVNHCCTFNFNPQICSVKILIAFLKKKIVYKKL